MPDFPDYVTFLSAQAAAAKRFSRDKETGAVHVENYGRAKSFMVDVYGLTNIRLMAKGLANVESWSNSFLIRGHSLNGEQIQKTFRRIHTRKLEDGTVEEATFESAAHHWVPLDIDSLPCPDGMDPINDPGAAVEHIVTHLPPEFHGVTCFWQHTSSAGMKPGIRMRLYFWADRLLSDEDLKTWLGATDDAGQRLYPVDLSIFSPVQPIYTAKPTFDGVTDPVPQRCGLWEGDRDEITAPVIVKAPQATAHRHSNSNTPTSGSGTAASGTARPAYNPAGGGGYDGHRGRIGDHEAGGGFHGPIKAAVAAWLARNCAAVDPAWLRADLEAAIRVADRSKHDAAYIEVRIGDLDPLIAAIRRLQATKDAAKPEQPPEATSPKPTFDGADEVTLPEGERLAAQQAAAFMAKVRGWHNWPGEQIKPYRPAPLGALDFNTPEPGPEPPCHLFKWTLALGKTQAIADLCAEVPKDEHATVYCRDHALVAETAGRIRSRIGGKHRVVPFYGREQDHPDGGPMCHEAELARAVSACGQSVRDHLCKREVSPGKFEHCRHHPDIGNGCRYENQAADTDPAIRVAPHAYLGIGAGNPLPRGAVNFVDEDPMAALVRDGESYGVPLRLITKTDWITKSRRQEKQADEIQSARDYSKALHDVLAEAQPTPAKLRAAGLDDGNTRWMAGKWYDQVDELAVTPAMPRNKKHDAITVYKSQLALKMGRLWTLIHDVINLPLDELRCIRVEEVMKEHPETMVLMVWSIDPKIDGPIAIFDGTANAEIARRFWPDVGISTINVKPEHYHAIQVTDRPVSKTMLGYGLGGILKNPREDEGKRAKNRRADLARIAEVAASKVPFGSTIPLMTYLPVAEALRREHPMLAEIGVEVGFQRHDGKWAGHHGAERGTDRWRYAPAAIIAGRNLPPRDAQERQARAIFYKDARPMTYQGAGIYDTETRFIRMADGTGRAVMNETHPDPLIRACLDQVRATAEQEVGRLRLIRRTAADAPSVIIATNTVLNLTIHETVTWDELVPTHADMLMARGVVPSDWPGRALVLDGMLEDAADKAHALRCAAGKDAAAWTSVVCVSDPNKESILGSETHTTAYRYRRAGQRKGGTVQVSNRHPFPALAALAWLGPLDKFELVATQSTATELIEAEPAIPNMAVAVDAYTGPTVSAVLATTERRPDIPPDGPETAPWLFPHFPSDELPPLGLLIGGRPAETFRQYGADVIRPARWWLDFNDAEPQVIWRDAA